MSASRIASFLSTALKVFTIGSFERQIKRKRPLRFLCRPFFHTVPKKVERCKKIELSVLPTIHSSINPGLSFDGVKIKILKSQ